VRWNRRPSDTLKSRVPVFGAVVSLYFDCAVFR